MKLLRTGAIALFSASSILLGLLDGSAEADTRITRLNAFDEVPVVISGATGELRLKIDRDEQSIEYTLSYENIEGGDVLQAHIHLGQKHTSGMIVVFLCTNLGNAPPSATHPTPACPLGPNGSVSGTLDASNVIERAAQGVGAGDLAAVIEGIRKGVVYANVHTMVSPSGEIRGNFPSKY